MTERRQRNPHRARDAVVITAVIGLLAVVAWVLVDQVTTTERAADAEGQVEVVEDQRDNAVAEAKDLGQQVVIEVCSSTDPADLARFAVLCRAAREAAAQPVSDPDDPERQDPEIQDPEVQDPEIPDGEPPDPEIDDPDPDDPEIQDPEVDDPEPNDPQDPAAAWSFRTADGAEWSCVRDEASDPRSPTYTCTGPPMMGCPGVWEYVLFPDGEFGYRCR